MICQHMLQQNDCVHCLREAVKTAATAEREACASVCDEVGKELWLLTINHASQCAARIRARGDT